MLEAISLLLKAQIWILVSLNARIAGSGDIQHICVESKRPNALSVIVLIKLNIIINLPGVVKLTKKLIL